MLEMSLIRFNAVVRKEGAAVVKKVVAPVAAYAAPAYHHPIGAYAAPVAAAYHHPIGAYGAPVVKAAIASPYYG